jgi:hypothetical protein
MATAWTESKLACLWGRQKTARLVASGVLRPYHIDDEGERCFAHDDVMMHYAYKSAGAPGQACCACCGHCAEPSSSEASFAKAFSGGGAALYAEDDDGDVPEFLDGDYSLDEDPEPDLDDDDEDWSEPGEGEPDEDELDALDLDDDEVVELEGESLADYHNKRLAEVAAIEKLAGAADALTLETALTALQVGQLAFRAAVARTFG